MKAHYWLGGIAAVMIIAAGAWLLIFREQAVPIVPVFQNEPLAAQVHLTGGTPRAGQTQHVHVAVQKEGQPFALHDNGYAIHLIVASADQTSFLHTVDLHQDEVGVYGADVTFGPPGLYRVWVEVNDAHGEQHHHEGAGFFGFADFQVGGQAADAPVQPRVYGKTAQTGPYTVKLDHETLKAGEASEVRLTVQDAAGRTRALTQPEPNIYVIVGPKGDSQFEFIRHGHSETARNGNTVVWQETFPKAGEYLLWTTVYLAGMTATAQTEAIEVPFVLTVSEE